MSNTLFDTIQRTDLDRLTELAIQIAARHPVTDEIIDRRISDLALRKMLHLNDRLIVEQDWEQFELNGVDVKMTGVLWSATADLIIPVSKEIQHAMMLELPVWVEFKTEASSIFSGRCFITNTKNVFAGGSPLVIPKTVARLGLQGILAPQIIEC